MGSLAGAPSAIGRYQILDLIATGGMAEVYLARHGEMSGYQTIVVVKRILPHLARDDRFVEMFLDEGRIASALDHPNIAKVLEVGHAGQEYFMAMELVQGESIAGIVAEAKEKGVRISPSLASLMIAHAAAGLHHAHTMTDGKGRPLNIVHRDVSPQNILVSFDGAVKVIDFGVARALGRVTQTKTGGVKGKIAYMAPEQARGEAVDQRTDVFALGVVLWEMLTGRRLFARETELATMRAILDEPYPRLTDFADVKPMLAAIVGRTLERDASARFDSAQELEIALEKYIATEGFIGTGDLAREMKALFPEEHLRWKQWVRSAMSLPSSQEDAVQRAMTLEEGASQPTLILRQPQPPSHRSGSFSGDVARRAAGDAVRRSSTALSRRAAPSRSGSGYRAEHAHRASHPSAQPLRSSSARPAPTPAHHTAPAEMTPARTERLSSVPSSIARLWAFLGVAWLVLVGGGVGLGVLYVRSRPTPAPPAPITIRPAPTQPVATPLPVGTSEVQGGHTTAIQQSAPASDAGIDGASAP